MKSNRTTTIKDTTLRFLNKFLHFWIPPQPEKFFLRWFLLISILLSFILPPFMGPDEASHIYRAYEFSKGDLTLNKIDDGYGFNVSTPLVHLNQDQFWGNSHQPFLTALSNNVKTDSINTGGTTSQFFENTSVYSPLAYAHYIVVMWFAELVNANVFVTFLLLRFINIALFAFLAYKAIKIMPKRKWFLVAVALLPMAIHQATVVSPDGVINGFALVVVALVALGLVQKKFLGYKYLILLAVSIFIVAFSKQAYLFLPLVLLVLPKSVFPKALSKARYIIVVSVIVLGSLLAWTAISSASSSAAFQQWRTRDDFGATKSTTTFVKDLIKHPINSTLFVAHSFVYSIATPDQASLSHPEFYAHNQAANFTWQSFLGTFGSLMIGYPIWVYPIVVAGLIIPLLAERHTFLDRRRRWVIVGLIAVMFITLAMVLWWKWTSVTDPAIVGFQGRYLLPIVGLLVFLPSARYLTLNKLRDTQLSKIMAIIIGIEAFMMLLVIFTRFYQGF